MLAQIAAETEVIQEVPGMLEQLLIDWGVPVSSAGWLTIAGGLTVTIILAVIVNFIAKFILIKVVHRFVKFSKTDWDDVLLERRVFHRFSHLFPAIVIYAVAPIVMEGHSAAEMVMQKFAYIYLVLIAVLIIGSGIGLFYYLRIVFAMSKRPAADTVVEQPAAVPFVGGFVMLTVTGTLLVLGVYPTPVIELINSMVRSLPL
jgi:miniconductance mechanosensitive channel